MLASLTSLGVAPIFRSLVTLSLFLTLLTVILSAYIRLAEVGVGCDGWPDCYAQLNPVTEKKGVTVLTDAGRDMAHYGARVAHRYIASTLGLFIVVIFAVALMQRRARATSLLVPATIFAVTVFLSLLGYYTPTRSNPLITMGNLLGGMTLLGMLWWLMQRETQAGLAAGDTVKFRPVVAVAMCLVLFQIVLGGWASANYASTSCPGLLQCRGEFLVVSHFGDAFNPFRQIALDNAGQVQRSDSLGLMSMAHRLFALLTAAYLAWMVRQLKSKPELSVPVLALSLFSISQVVFGVSMIWLQLPLALLTLHNALAAGLLLATVNLLHHVTPAKASPLLR